ncbi:ABC transporter permease subunit [Clostridium polynesiense]|uniref:ABC transporter permease subunit n=1 Tax=Clostridium polynesiense TaxID=1325933 RepID=UPI00058CAB86|nr:ABC transporter permease [Clostridium polynesiense]
MKEEVSIISKIKEWLFNNMVTILFVVLCAAGIEVSRQPLSFVLGELVTRIARNLFLVLSLIIPVLAGMGLNFGIVIGAMAGQIAIIAVTHWKIAGIGGFLLCILISTPIAILFGYFTGKLLNKTKGQEMIASMILALFANGLYQLLFLFFVGTIIPMDNPVMVLSGGIGIKNTLDLTGGIKYTLDSLFEMDLFVTIMGLLAAAILYNLIKMLINYRRTKKTGGKYLFNLLIIIAAMLCSILIPKLNFAFKFVNVPIITLFVIGAVALFNSFLYRTKLGQDLRTVGQDMHVANASGIKVNKVRIIAIVISTVLAAWGQLIFLQNIGTLNTYGSHEQVGMFSIAALLIGGASVSKATNGQALLGVILFHTLFIISPTAGKNLFDNPQIGEYFRGFIAYGVIGVSLGIYAWKKSVETRRLIE